MAQNFRVFKKENKSKSLMYKMFEIDNNDKKVSWKTIKSGYDTLLNNGYDKKQIYVKVMTPIGIRTIKGFDEDLENSLENYFINKVKDTSKFSKNFTKVYYGIYE